MRFDVFNGICAIHGLDGGLAGPAALHRLNVQISLDDADPSKVWFTVGDAISAESGEIALTLSTPHKVTQAKLGRETFELSIDLSVSANRQAFEDNGIAGFTMGASAELSSVTITLRTSQPDGSWTPQAPFLALTGCWILTGNAAGSVAIGKNDLVKAATAAEAQVTACAGFACINPPDVDFSIDDLQVRFDLESFAIGTGWLPLRMIDVSGWSLFHLNGLGKWFAKLAEVSNLDLDSIELPDWGLDMPVAFDLPFGLQIEETELSLLKQGDGYTVAARLERLALVWDGQPVAQWSDFRASVTIDPVSGSYKIDLRLFEEHYPKTPAEVGKDYEFALLPLDALSLSAECWRLRVGMHTGGDEDGLGKLCIDFLLEIGGLQVISGLVGGKKEPLFQTDLRLHMRNFSILMKDPDDILEPKDFFDGVGTDALPEVVAVFGKYRDQYTNAHSDLRKQFTFARDLGAAPSKAPPNDYGLAFIDGDLRKGERLYLAWSQVGTRFLDALSHDLFATPPAGLLPDEARPVYLALEVSWFGEDDTQIRLDWLDGDRPLQRRQPQGQAKWSPIPDSVPQQHELNDFSIGKSIPLPHDGKGVAIAPFSSSEQSIRVSIPGIRFDFARPKARSIVLRREENTDSVAYLFLYDPPEGNPAFAAQVARAEIGFSLTEPDSGTREVMSNSKDKNDEPFLTLGAGHLRDEAIAIRVLGWRQGQGIRFADTLSPDASAPRILAKKQAILPSWINGCPPPPQPPQPVVPMLYGDFDTPDFASNGWQYAFRIGALDKVMDLFGGSQNTPPAKLDITRVIYEEGARDVLIETTITLKLGSFAPGKEVKGAVIFRFDPADGALSIEDAATLTLTQKRGKEPAWAQTVPLPPVEAGKKRIWADPTELVGLKGHLFADIDEKQADALPGDAQLEFLTLKLDRGRLSVGLSDEADMVVRYEGFGRDALNFLVEEFELGPGGLTLKAGLILSTLRVRGLNAPFSLEQARLEIIDDRLEMLSVEASGVLPKLLNEAPVSLTVTFKQVEPAKQGEARKIELDELICELGSKDEPIFSRGTRFKFEIKTLELRYGGAGANRNFFFVITGSAQFTPNPGEFDNGLLENLKSVRCDFVEAPLSDEFADELQIMVELNEPVSFNMYNLFRMEIRSIGFDPKFDEFAEPGAAIVIGGQCEFAALGDVVSAAIDFHACRIGMPKQGEALPQIHFDGLRVDISSPEGFRIAGMVKRYEGDLIRGFAGEGTIGIPGFPELSAAFSFVRLRSDENSEWKHAWFVAIEASKMSIQIPPLPIYLRQVGLGFGYRYTLPLIKTFEDPKIKSLGDLIERMLKALDQHQTLARVDSWVPDPEQDGRSALWTVALEAVFTVGTQQAGLFDYDARKEQNLKTLVAQVIAAIRSDFTLVAAAKIWFPVSVDDFFRDEEGMRNRPLARGFMLYSAPQKRFLAHAAKHDNPYLGKPDDPWPKEVHALFKNSHFEATLLIEPGLLHAELGWPDRLMYRWSIGSLEIEVRAGVLMRIENDAIVQGVFLSARGGMELSGGIDLGFTGVRLTARVDVYFATRLMTALYLSRPLDSKIYAEIGLDVAVRFSVQAWLRLKLGFVKINFNISFSFSVQIVVGLQLGWNGISELGFKGRATVVIGVFGRSLRAGIAVGINEGAVEGARAALLPYMSSFLAPGEPPRLPDGNLLNERIGGRRGLSSESRSMRRLLETASDLASLKTRPGPVTLEEPIEEGFVLTHVKGRLQGKETTFIWIMPGPNEKTFYPVQKEDLPGWHRYARIEGATGAMGYDPNTGGFTRDLDVDFDLWTQQCAGTSYEDENGNSKDPDDEPYSLTLRQLLAGCYTLDPNQPDWAANGKQLPEDYDAQAPLKMPSDTPLGAPLEDTRLREDDSAQRNPKRELNPNDPFDRALMDAMAEAENRRRSPEEAAREQAIGSQSFLLQCFYDDLVALANDGLEAVAAIDSRPTLLDLGLVFVVKGDAPEWVTRRDATTVNLTFEDGFAQPGSKPGQVHEMRPVVDFTRLDFAQYPPIFNEPVTFQDEEILAVGWRLGWGGGIPAHADGADMEPESFLKSYRIRVIDASTRRTLLQRTVKPADLMGAKRVDETGERLQRVRPRYQLTLPLSELFGEGLPAGQMLRKLAVTVTPEDQSGGLGESYTFAPGLEPTLKPLPADDATCLLDTDATGKPTATLKWREPALPNRPGVAGTDGWDLILRPLQQVPMGAYPEEASEAEDRGLMSATGQALLDGDLVLDVKSIASQDGAQLNHTQRDYKVLLAPFSEGTPLKSATPRDHQGNAVNKDHPSFKAWTAFRDGRSGNDVDGQAWRLFLRARHEPNVTGEALKPTYSGLAPVRLRAALAVDENAAGNDVLETTATVPLRERPLPHFEWPATEQSKDLIVLEPRAEAGALHVPVLRQDSCLDYLRAPSRTRVITLVWPAIGKGDRKSYAATADFTVYATDLDRLVNADLLGEGTDGFGADWRRVARLQPADRRATGETPDTMADAQNWLNWPPSFSATRRWQDSNGIDDEDALDNWPGWYSWADSDLEWPDPLDRAASALDQIQARSEMSPSEITALPEKPKGAQLAAWFALGRQAAGGRAHPWLALITGWIAGQRMAQLSDIGIPPADVNQVEASTGQPVQERLPLDWLSANNSAVDPAGWNALGHLGLGLSLSLRDPVTGLSRDQAHVRDRVETAIKQLRSHATELPALANSLKTDLLSVLDKWDRQPHKTLINDPLLQKISDLVALPGDALKELDLLALDRLDKAITNRPKAALEKARDDCENIETAAGLLLADCKAFAKHLAFDSPLQAIWARRAGPDRPNLSDAALRMLHVSLRPVPRVRMAPVALTVTPDLLTGAVKSPLRVAWRNRNQAPGIFEEKNLSEFLRAGDSIYAIALPRQDGTSEWPESWLEAGDLKAGITKYPAPLPLDGLSELDPDTPHSSPYGAFSPDPATLSSRWKLKAAEDWRSVTSDEATETCRQFALAVTYLLRAFAPAADADEDTLRKLAEPLISKDAPRKALEPFLKWSSRFFVSAPLTTLVSGTPGWLDDVNLQTAVSAPKTLDPLRVSADTDGRMQITLPVEEEWATTRSYAVLATDRYARMRAALPNLGTPARVEPRALPPALRAEMMKPEHRADSQLPRVRKIEPPQVLGQNIVLLDEVPHHVLSIARHSENWLHNAALPLRRKIEFGATTRSYRRAPLDRITKWGNQLVQAQWIATGPALPVSDNAAQPRKVVPKVLGDLDEVRLTHLARVPKLRLSGDVHITGADPFWYQTTVTVSAYAGTVQSREKDTALSIAPPSATFALGDDPVSFSSKIEDWPELSVFSVEIQTRIATWRPHFIAEATPYIAPQARLLNIRLPRLIESLPVGSTGQDGLYAAETTTGTFGNLPDPGLSLHITHEVSGSEATLLSVAPILEDETSGGGQTEPYKVTTLDDSLVPITTIKVDGSQAWDQGLAVELPIRHHDAVVQTSLAPPEILIDTLGDTPADEFPALGSMRQLLPLALRLHARSDGMDTFLHYTDPLYGNAWLCLPHLTPGTPVPISDRVLTQGISLVIDRHKRHAGGWLAADQAILADAGQDSSVVYEALKTAGLSIMAHLCQPRNQIDLWMHEDQLANFGVTLWIREEDEGASGWHKFVRDQTPQENIRALITLSEITQNQGESDADFQKRKAQQLPEFQRLWEYVDRLDPAEVTDALTLIGEASRVAADLAGQGFQATAMPDPKVYVQRGNAPRRAWNPLPEEGVQPEEAVEVEAEL